MTAVLILLAALVVICSRRSRPAPTAARPTPATATARTGSSRHGSLARHSSGGRRSRFVAPRRFFSSSRRSCDAARRLRRAPPAPDARRLAQLLDDPVGRELAVPQLRPLVLRDRADDRPEPLEHAPLLAPRSAPPSASTSNSASTRVELFCACWPPGPLEREKRKATSDRIESASMAAILLDVDGVLHVSGRPDHRARSTRSRRLRGDGHRIRFVTNSTTMSRAQLADQLRAIGLRARRTTSCRRPAASPPRRSRASACSR